MMSRLITAIACVMVAVFASAQFTQPGFYRVHNVGTDRYVCIKGTEYNKSTRPDAFWSCIKMLNDSDQIADPGSIIYIPEMGQTSLCAQGVSTYSLTGLWLEIDTANVQEQDKPTYVAKTIYNYMPCIFRDYGNGLTAGSIEAPATHWWVEPVNAESMDTSFLGVKPVNEAVTDQDGYYWATMCCDFTFVLPLDGGVEGAYTVDEIKMGNDGLYYAEPVKLYGQGDSVPAATPVLLKCKAPYASGNKIVPIAPIANHTTMPIVNDLLMGNYFSNFINHSHLTIYTQTAMYIPEQATKASPENLALGVNEEGKLGFFPQADTTYMTANSAWLSTTLIDETLPDDLTAVYLGIAPVDEPQPEPIRGDANGDGELSISDVTLMIQLLLNNDSKGCEIEIDVLDFNEDGEFSITDITCLLRSLLNNDNDE